MKSTTVEEMFAVVDKSIQFFPDSSFFSDIRHIKYEDGYLYMLDVKRRNVVRLNLSLTEMKEYGTGGRGPGELQAPFSFSIRGDTVSILDFMSRSLKQYSSTGYINEVNLDVIPNDGRIDMTLDNDFLVPLLSDTYQFSIVSKDGCRSLGCPQHFKTIKKTTVYNHNHVLHYKDKIVVVPSTLPYAQVYDKKGCFLKIIDLNKTQFYKKNLSYIASQANFSKDNVSYVLNVDAYIVDDILYVLCSRFGNTYMSDRILAVDLNKCDVKKVILLPDANYGSICSDGSRFYVFNADNTSLDILMEKNS